MTEDLDVSDHETRADAKHGADHCHPIVSLSHHLGHHQSFISTHHINIHIQEPQQYGIVMDASKCRNSIRHSQEVFIK